MSARTIELVDIPYIITQLAHVIWLRGPEYQNLLYAYLRTLASKRACILQSLPCNDVSLEESQARYSTAFLGQSYTYWMGNIAELPKKKLEQWHVFLSEYRGPHSLLFYAPPDFVITVPEAWLVVNIKNRLTKTEIEQITRSWYDTVEARTICFILRGIYTKFPATDILLTSFLEIAMYARVLGKQQIHDFLTVYGPHISLQQPSLFALANFFFSNNATAFYAEWAKTSSLYQPPFWVVFWSDHLWRAHAFIMYMNKGEKNNAYEIAKNRLPYMFIKQGWHTIDPLRLQIAHQRLYTIDTRIKNGSNAEWLELFFCNWFSLVVQERSHTTSHI